MTKPTLFLFFGLLTTSVHAHMRLECPPPRSAKTGAKAGPCDAPDDLSLPAFPLVANALNTITWLESIPHPAAPLRVALSSDGADDGFEQCLLLDHIPHDEWSKPSFRNEPTYHRSSITLWIPDIYCERCSLQLVSIMSDSVHGVPDDTYCVYKGAKEAGTADPSLPACPAVYHSCAPVSINGTIPRNQIDQCNTPQLEQLLDWPFTGIGNNQNYSTYWAKGNPGMFNQTDARLLSGGEPIGKDCSSFQFCDPEKFYQEAVAVPPSALYTAMAGTCAAIVGMQVEPFELGKLPDQMMFEVEMDDHSNISFTGGCETNYNCTEDDELLAVSKKYNDATDDENDAEDDISAEDETTSGAGPGLRQALGGLLLLVLGFSL